MKYRVLQGNHAQDEEVYKKGDIVESHLDLCALFVNKFERVYTSEDFRNEEKAAKVSKPVKPKKETKGKAKGSDKAGSDKPAESGPGRGTLVTDQFPLAHEEGFEVYQRSSWFHVYDAEEKDGKPLNEKGLKKDLVDEFVKTHLEE